MHCLPDFIYTPFRNLMTNKNNMSDLQTNTMFKTYSEGINSIKELENENHISSEDSQLLTEMLSFLYVYGRFNNILDNFSGRIEKKLITSLDRIFENEWLYYGK